MKNLEEIKRAVREKLVGYTDREIECFVQGAVFMAGHLPERRTEEWYRQRDRRRQQQADSAEEVLHVLQDVTGLGKAVEAMNNARTEGEIIDHAFTVLMRHMLFDPGYRAMMLEKLDAEEAHASRALIHNVKDGCRAFNRTHEAQIFFTQEEEADNQWVLTWEDPV